MNAHRQTDWFDFSSQLGDGSIRAILSKKNGFNAAHSLDEYRQQLLRELNLEPAQVGIPHQKHTPTVQWARPGQVHEHTDGLFTADPAIALTLQVADCAPLYFYHPASGVRGLVHVGWRGAADGIIQASLDLTRSVGLGPAGFKVFIGPTIVQACYEVGEEVIEKFPPDVWQANDRGRYQLDLMGAILQQLTEAGIDPGNIETAGVCSHCSTECHSYRRDGTGAGRMIAFLYSTG